MNLSGRRHPTLDRVAGCFPFPSNSGDASLADTLVERHHCSESVSLGNLTLPARPGRQVFGAQAINQVSSLFEGAGGRGSQNRPAVSGFQ